jgi:hypothetical protein
MVAGADHYLFIVAGGIDFLYPIVGSSAFYLHALLTEGEA